MPHATSSNFLRSLADLRQNNHCIVHYGKTNHERDFGASSTLALGLVLKSFMTFSFSILLCISLNLFLQSYGILMFSSYVVSSITESSNTMVADQVATRPGTNNPPPPMGKFL
jgi:hypothetical protein